MALTSFPTSKDIYIEIGGVKVAVVQSYKCSTSASSKYIEAFGESEPVAAINAHRRYDIEVSRLYATDQALLDGISFYDLEDFSLVISKPDRKIIYTGCRWSSITETGVLNEAVLENVRIAAAHRLEVKR